MKLRIKEELKTDKKFSFADTVGCESEDETFYLNEENSDERIVHPETTILIPVGPWSNKKKTIRCSLDLCTTSSLMD